VVTQSLDSAQSAELQRGHTARWTAPEVLDEKPYSKEADVFSFAMVMIEVRHSEGTYHVSNFRRPAFCINLGIYRRDSFQRWLPPRGYYTYNTRQAPAPPHASSVHRGVVGVDATLLGSRASLAPGSLGNLASSHPVGVFLFQ